jgi:hypothetical protein
MRNSVIQIDLNIEVRDDLSVPIGTHEFRARAWGAANGKARELGWIV